MQSNTSVWAGVQDGGVWGTKNNDNRWVPVTCGFLLQLGCSGKTETTLNKTCCQKQQKKGKTNQSAKKRKEQSYRCAAFPQFSTECRDLNCDWHYLTYILLLLCENCRVDAAHIRRAITFLHARQWQRRSCPCTWIPQFSTEWRDFNCNMHYLSHLLLPMCENCRADAAHIRRAITPLLSWQWQRQAILNRIPWFQLQYALFIMNIVPDVRELLCRCYVYEQRNYSIAMPAGAIWSFCSQSLHFRGRGWIFRGRKQQSSGPFPQFSTEFRDFNCDWHYLSYMLYHHSRFAVQSTGGFC